MTTEDLEKQRRSQEALGNMAAAMGGLVWEPFELGGMDAAWMRLERRSQAPPGHPLLPRRGLHQRRAGLFQGPRQQAHARHGPGRARLRLPPRARAPLSRRRGGRAGRLGPPDAPRLRRAGRGARGRLRGREHGAGALPQAPRRGADAARGAAAHVALDGHDLLRREPHRARGHRPRAHARIHLRRARGLRRRPRPRAAGALARCWPTSPDSRRRSYRSARTRYSSPTPNASPSA